MNRDNVDIIINRKDYTKFMQLCNSFTPMDVLTTVAEKHRINQIVKTQDLEFIKNVFYTLDNLTYPNLTYHNLNLHNTRSKDPKYKKLYEDNKKEKIDAFKSVVMSKCLSSKKNADTKYVDNACAIIRKNNLLTPYVIRRFADVAFNSDFERIHNKILNHNLFNDSAVKTEYLTHVFQATTDISRLEILMKTSEKEIRNIFFEKDKKDEFWFDFVPLKRPLEHYKYDMLFASGRPSEAKKEKLFWLEKQHMGYSHISAPHFINFFKNFEFEEIDVILESLDKDKYIRMFDKVISEYDKYKFSENKVDDDTAELLKSLEFKNHRDHTSLYDNLKVKALKVNLDQTLKVNTVPTKIKKI